MSELDESKVSITSDTGIKQQWARGLFYRKDGKKSTLATKRLIWIGALAFGIAAIVLLLQDNQEVEQLSDKQKTTIPISAGVPQASSYVDVPTQYSQAKQALDGSTSRTRSTGSNNNAGLGSDGARRRTIYVGPQVIDRPRLVKIPPGSMVKAVLISGGSNGPVKAEITESLTINGETVIETGNILLGTGQSTEERLFIRFTQMVLKGGTYDSIQAQACDFEDKMPGLHGSKVGNLALKLAAGVGLNFVAGMSDGLQDQEVHSGIAVRKPSLRNAMLNGAQTAALDQSREIISNAKNKPPIVEVPQGTPIYVLYEGN